MTINEIREKIMTDDAFVLSEAEKILYLYTLKHTIRYGQNRHEKDYTESVAEHIWGMQVLADYFLPLEYPESKLDRDRISSLVVWHELGEIETGDIPNIRKTDKDRRREAELVKTVIEKSPYILKEKMKEFSDEYESQTTEESKFVKAVDKIEPLIHCYHPLGKKTQHELQLPVSASINAKKDYIEQHQTIKRFSEVLHHHMDKNGYFYPEN